MQLSITLNFNISRINLSWYFINDLKVPTSEILLLLLLFRHTVHTRLIARIFLCSIPFCLTVIPDCY